MTTTGPGAGAGMGADQTTARYVERGGEIVFRQPFRFEGVRLFGFGLEAHHANLARSLYRTFTEPSGGEVQLEPLGHCVLLAFMAAKKVRSSEPPDDRLGFGPETEAAIWVPTIDRASGHLAWTLPYMFIEQPAALACGRETYGFPKQLGTIAIDSADPPASFRVGTPTVARHGPESLISPEEVIAVTRPQAGYPPSIQWSDPADVHTRLLAASGSAHRGPGPARGGRLQSLVADALAAVHRSSRAFVDAPEVAALLVEGFVGGKLPIVLLKQFRSCEDPAAACYQSIVNVDFNITECRQAAPLPEDYTVDIAALDGNPLIADLGLPASSRPKVAFTLDFDFDTPRGSVVWSTTRPGP